MNHINFKSFISESDIKDRVKQLGQQITCDHQDGEIILVSVLKGAFIFTADLIRSIDKPVQVEFIGVASYSGTQSSGHVRITNDLTAEIKGKQVILVEDVIDTGKTIDFLIDTLSIREPKSLKVCTLLSKPEVHAMHNKIDYVGFEVSKEFVIGYGLDLDGYYRGIPYLAQVINHTEK